MFLDKQTFDKFGYYPNDLFPSSHRKVFNQEVLKEIGVLK